MFYVPPAGPYAGQAVGAAHGGRGSSGGGLPARSAILSSIFSRSLLFNFPFAFFAASREKLVLRGHSHQLSVRLLHPAFLCQRIKQSLKLWLGLKRGAG